MNEFDDELENFMKKMFDIREQYVDDSLSEADMSMMVLGACNTIKQAIAKHVIGEDEPTTYFSRRLGEDIAILNKTLPVRNQLRAEQRQKLNLK